MSGFTFLLFLSVFVFGVCVAPIHRYWEVGAFLAKYGVSKTELFGCYLRNLDHVYGYVDYQEDNLVVDHNTIKSLLQTVQSSTVCNLPYSLFRTVENDPVKLRASVLNLMTMLSDMGDESSEEFFLLLDLQKRLDQASGLSLFSTQPKLINGTHILNKRGVAVVYRVNDVSVHRSYLDRRLHYLQWYDDGANVIPAIAAVRRELAELDAVTPGSVSWCSIKPVEDTTDTQLQLRYALFQIQENQKYLDRVANATLPETIQEKKNLATYWTVVMGKMQDLAVQRHSEYAGISVSDRESYFNRRLETLADTAICMDVYQITSVGVCATYVELLSDIDSYLPVRHDRQFNAARSKLYEDGVYNERGEAPDIPIKFYRPGGTKERHELRKRSLEIIIGYLATSGPSTEARKMEFGMLSTFQKLFTSAHG